MMVLLMISAFLFSWMPYAIVCILKVCPLYQFHKITLKQRSMKQRDIEKYMNVSEHANI